MSRAETRRRIPGGTTLQGRLHIPVIALLCLHAATASNVTTAGSVAPSSYILIANELRLPASLEDQVTAIGGSIAISLPQIGVAIAMSADSDFAAKAASITGLRSAIRDATIALDPSAGVSAIAVGKTPASGDDDSLFDMQWALDAIDVPEAWAQGFRGAGARVAVLDTGIDIDHPDLAPNLDVALSTSFVPGVGLQAPPGPPSFTAPAHHGTLVAGIIAAADNGVGTIGVAPEAEIVAIRVCSDDGRCAFSAILAGLVYAASIEADVVNVSLGALGSRRGFVDADGNTLTASDVAELLLAFTRAFQLTHSRGSTNVVSAGNSGRDLDGDADGVHFLSQLPHTIGVAATAPRGWALDPTTTLDTPTRYTNYGQSAIDLAAPGGDLDFDAFFTQPWTFCSVVVTLPCFLFDLVVGPTVDGWSLNFGTSMSAPHVSGVAALVIGANGGRMHPAAVDAVLRASADDLGKPGVDDYYGHGRVNAAKALLMR
jgi:lantibiotic leader peptide-processing serine protease